MAQDKLLKALDDSQEAVAQALRVCLERIETAREEMAAAAREKNDLIAKLRERGYSLSEIGAMTGVSRQAIWNAVNK